MNNTFKQTSPYKWQFTSQWLMKHFMEERASHFINSQKLANKRARNLEKLQKMNHLGRGLPIEKVENLSASEFIAKYRDHNQPVVLKGAAKKWKCVQQWTPELLDQRYGNDLIPLIDASPEVVTDPDYSLRTVRFSEVIQGMKDGNNSLYSRFNDLLGQHPELIEDLDKDWFLERRELFSSGKVFQCFVGGAGTYTHLHSAVQSNFFVEIFGTKRWILYPPSYNQYLTPIVEGRPYFSTYFHPQKPDFGKYPEMKYLDYYDFTLEPGDILYNPPSWWHHVINETMSIGVGFRWTSLSATLRSSPMQLLLTLTAYNPSVLFAIKSRGNFAKVFSYKRKKS